MQISLISYLAGMSGDFLTFQIHNDTKYSDLDSAFDLQGGRTITAQNMWRFPNLLRPIGLEAKVYPQIKSYWEINEQQLDILRAHYGNRNIVLPTHWYRRFHPSHPFIFKNAVRLYAKTDKVLKIAYAMWWIKSHVVANEIWEHRKEELDAYVKQYPDKTDLVNSIKEPGNYHNWKFLSIYYDLLKDGKLDLDHYIRMHYSKIYKGRGNRVIHTHKWNYYDIDDIFYNNMSNLELLEKQFDVSINRDVVNEYVETNKKLLKEILGFSIDSAEFENDETYFNAIINYSKDIIDGNTNQFSYYNRNN